MREKRASAARPSTKRTEHEGAGPAHDVPAVGLDAVGDADHQRHQADGEGEVPAPVDVVVALARAPRAASCRPRSEPKMPTGTEMMKMSRH